MSHPSPSSKKESLKRPGGFIFDYGGTIDTRGCHWGKMLWHAYERQQVPVSEVAFREAYVYAERTLGKNPIIQSSYTFHTTLKVKLRIEMDYLRERYMKTLSTTEEEHLVETLLADLYERVLETTAESRKALEILAGDFPLVLVSNFYGNIGVVLEEFNLAHLFRHVIESAVVGVRKPNPAIFQMGADALGLMPGDIVVVGDNYDKDLLPAHGMGCRTIWVKGEEWTPQAERECFAEAVLTDGLATLPSLFGMAGGNEETTTFIKGTNQN